MKINTSIHRTAFALCLTLFALSDSLLSAGEFTSLGHPVRKGGLMGCLVGPDGKGGEALYFNFNQLSGSLFLVQVNPDTGESRQFNAPEGPGAWAFLVGPDNKIYLGTWSGALILRFDPERPDDGIKVNGKPSPTEDYIWQFANGPDGWMYGCTYPQAKLVRYQPATGTMEDLGRMHPREMYARSVAVGKDGLVYTGIGTTEGDLVVYDPKTREHRSIIPKDMQGAAGWATVGVSLRDDGDAYAEFGTNFMSLSNGVATKKETGPARPLMKLKDGRIVTAFGRGDFTLTDPATKQSVSRKFTYDASGDRIFMVAPGPGGNVYGSTAMPLEVFRHDPASGKSEHLGAMPGGEVYSMLERGGKQYMCYYGGAIMNLYDPSKPWNWGSAADSNPISFGGVGDGHLRPRAMIYGPGGIIYVGSEPPYGELGGAMGVWDPVTNKNIENYRHLVKNQSIVSLAWDETNNLIWGGSGNFGGGGTQPTEKEALFFAFDLAKKEKVFESALLPGAPNYPATLVASGKIITTARDKMFIIDPTTRAVEKTLALDGPQLEVALGQDSKGRILGLTRKGVYTLDPTSWTITHFSKSPVAIDCGFAIMGDSVYFGSGSELWRYQI